MIEEAALPTPAALLESATPEDRAALSSLVAPDTNGPVVAPHPDQLRAFLRTPDVRRRILDYLGGPSLEDSTARFVSHPAVWPDRLSGPQPVETVWELLDRDLEAARSLWDRSSLLVHLDIEHVCFDVPWVPLADLERSAALQDPVVSAIKAILREHHIAPLHLLTGRGHHFVWRVGRDTVAFAMLARLGNLDDELLRVYQEPQVPSGETVGATLGAAQHGLGKVIEYLGHRVLERVGADCEVPVQLGEVVVGPGLHGREIVSIDLSQFGDPLNVRSVRLPFSLYRKAGILGAPPELAQRTMITVPVPENEPESAFMARCDLGLAAALARTTSTAIPEAARGTESLVAAYRDSKLATFHREYEAVQPEPPHRWEATYGRLDTAELPWCVRRILDQPNDLLLQPGCIQLVVRALMAQGWHPRHVAGLIRSRYESDYGWIRGLHFEQPGVRADFYTRLFAGQVAVGSDRLMDLNCVSTQEKWLCSGSGCGWDLRTLRDRLLESTP